MSAKKKGRKPTVIKSDDQLGPLSAVAAYMKVGRTWLSGWKLRAEELAAEGVPSPFAGGKTCAAWVREFIRHPKNANFVPTTVYRTACPTQEPHRAASASGRSG